MSPRVTFVVDGSIDQPTGGYIYDRIVADGLRSRGIDVSVFSLDANDLVGENRRLATLVSSAERDDVIVIDELSHPRALVASLVHALSRRPGRPRLVALVHHLASSELAGLRAAARFAVELPLLRVADRIIVTSETTRAVVAKVARADRISVAAPGRDRLGERAEPPAPADRVRFLFLGSVTERKGVLDLLAAFASVKTDAALTIAGPLDREPDYAASVSRAAASDARVHIAGALTDDQVADALSTHDALVMPSRYEGFGMAIAEALAHGLAVVAARAGAIPEVVGDAGILVPAGDVAALARALEDIVAARSTLALLQRAACARKNALPTWAECIDRFAAAIV